MDLETLQNTLPAALGEASASAGDLGEAARQKAVDATSRSRCAEVFGQGAAEIKARLDAMMVSLTDFDAETTLRARAVELGEERLEQSRMSARKELPARWVKLCVGGVYFQPTWDTLCKDPESYFSMLRKGEFFVERDDAGAILIDRDAGSFQVVLEFLRSGRVPSLASECCRERLLEEAKFFNFRGLVRLLDSEAFYEDDIGPLNAQLRRAEAELRCRYSLHEELPESEGKAGKALMFDVFAAPSLFWQPQCDEAAASLLAHVPCIGCQSIQPVLVENPPSDRSIVADIGDFERRWGIFSQGLLKGLDWNDVFMAGGGVLRCLMQAPTAPAFPPRNQGFEEEVMLNATIRGSQISLYPSDAAFCSHVSQSAEWADSDIDLFLVGLSDEAAKYKIKDICTAIRANSNGRSVLAIRSEHAVTFLCSSGQASPGLMRKIQVLLRIYSCIEAALVGFDIDCATAAYDGSRVWMMPRCRRAINARCNLADSTRQSPSYEYRLLKYMRRGFLCAVPGYDANRVPATLFERSPVEAVGLGRLLVLIHRSVMPYLPAFLYKQRTAANNLLTTLGRGWSKRPKDGDLADWAFRRLQVGVPAIMDTSENKNRHISLETMARAAGLPTSDYSIEIATGRTMSQVEHAATRHFFPSDIFDEALAVPVPFIVVDVPQQGDRMADLLSPKEKVLTFRDLSYVSSLPLQVRFVTHNPGRQFVGSFRPVDSKWFDHAYM